MSDHGAGPRSIANPEIDITDVFAFPSPERPGHLVLVMNIFPFKEIEATRLLFSGRGSSTIASAFVLFSVASTGPSARVNGWRGGTRVQVIFEVPQASGDSLVQSGTCHGPASARFQSASATRGRSIIPRAPHLRRVPPRSVFHRPTVFWRDQAQPADSGSQRREFGGGPERTQYRR